MRVLCCLDGTNIEQISKAVTSFLKERALPAPILTLQLDTGCYNASEVIW